MLHISNPSYLGGWGRRTAMSWDYTLALQPRQQSKTVSKKKKEKRGRGGWITRSRDRNHPGQHGEIPSLLKTQKISWAWWRVHVIPATQEAEAGELPEPRRRRLWWAKFAPLHSSLGNKSETPSQKIIIIKSKKKKFKGGNGKLKGKKIFWSGNMKIPLEKWELLIKCSRLITCLSLPL